MENFCSRIKLSASIRFPSFFQYEKVSTNTTLTNMTGKFRSNVWDPTLIIAQIITMQCLYYITLGLTSALLLKFLDQKPALEYLFDPSSSLLFGQEQAVIIFAHIINSLFGAVALWYIIQRAKQCLDFSCTLHFFNFIACCVYSGSLVTSFVWYFVQLVCIVLMVVIGEYLCFKTDLKDIPLVGANKADV